MRKPLQLVMLAAAAMLTALVSEAPALALNAAEAPQQRPAARQRPTARRQPDAQQNRQQPPRANEGQGRGQQGQGQGQARGQQFRGGRPGPVQQIQRLSQMSPEDRRRFLQNLNPRQRQEVMRRLQDWNRRTPAERQVMIERERVWQRMSPEQRQRARTEIFPRWQRLPQERRQAIQRRLRALAPLNEEERAARLQNEEFLRGLSDDDRALLRDLADLRLPPPDRDQDAPPPDPDAPPPDDIPPFF